MRTPSARAPCRSPRQPPGPSCRHSPQCYPAELADVRLLWVLPCFLEGARKGPHPSWAAWFGLRLRVPVRPRPAMHCSTTSVAQDGCGSLCTGHLSSSGTLLWLQPLVSEGMTGAPCTFVGWKSRQRHLREWSLSTAASTCQLGCFRCTSRCLHDLTHLRTCEGLTTIACMRCRCRLCMKIKPGIARDRTGTT